jgi:hypothetical protein
VLRLQGGGSSEVVNPFQTRSSDLHWRTLTKEVNRVDVDNVRITDKLDRRRCEQIPRSLGLAPTTPKFRSLSRSRQAIYVGKSIACPHGRRTTWLLVADTRYRQEDRDAASARAPQNGYASVASGFRPPAFPGERMSNDGLKIVKARVPAERLPDKLSLGHDPRRIARPPRYFFNPEIDA